MSTHFVVLLGLFSDLSAMTASFLRLFDADWHDCAETRSQIRDFSDRQRQCYRVSFNDDWLALWESINVLHIT